MYHNVCNKNKHNIILYIINLFVILSELVYKSYLLGCACYDAHVDDVDTVISHNQRNGGKCSVRSIWNYSNDVRKQKTNKQNIRQLVIYIYIYILYIYLLS